MYARPLTILAIIGISTASLYAYNIKTPEERIIESIRIQNQAIEEANSAKIDSYRSILDKCQKTATGTSREILEKLDACKDIQKPELQMIINYSGSIEGVSERVDSELIKMWKVTTQFMVIDETHKKICDKQINSPLCKDKELLARLYRITEDRIPGKNMFPILIWITNAESSLWLNFAKDSVGGKCDGRNNWWGTKYQILDNNTRVYSRKLNWFDYKNSKDQFGCNLYPFESIEEFFITKVNGMRFGYKSCIESKTPIDCIWRTYVKWDWKSKPSWNNNVAYFLF